MRWIHSRRKSPCGPAGRGRRTAGCASPARWRRGGPALVAVVALRALEVARRFFFAWTDRFTRATGSSFRDGDGDLRSGRGAPAAPRARRRPHRRASIRPTGRGTPGDVRRAAEAPLPGGRLLLEDVVHVGLPPTQAAGAGRLEALGGTAVGLHLRHRDLGRRGRRAGRLAVGGLIGGRPARVGPGDGVRSGPARPAARPGDGRPASPPPSPPAVAAACGPVRRPAPCDRGPAPSSCSGRPGERPRPHVLGA